MRLKQLEKLAALKTEFLAQWGQPATPGGFVKVGVIIYIIPAKDYLNETQMFLYTGLQKCDPEYDRISGIGVRFDRAVLLLDDGTFKIEFIKNLKAI